MQWYEREAELLVVKLELGDGMAEAEVTWKNKDGGPVLHTLNLISQVPTSGEVAEEFEEARKAILKVVSRMEEGRYAAQEDDDYADGMGWSR